MAGNNVQRYFEGDQRECARKCGTTITVTPQMVKSHVYYCAPCRSRATVESARLHREAKRRNNNAYRRRHPTTASVTAKWRANHPLKRQAHNAVQTALRNGSLLRQPCAVCGDNVHIHAHHDDYAKPLEVRWFCHTHHMEHHAMLKAREAQP